MGQRKKDPHQRLESLELWSARATLGILAGIALEVFALFWFCHSKGDRITGTAANVLIGVGLIIEYVVILRAITASGEANELSEQKVAEANSRAAEALQKAEEENRARVELETQLSRRVLTKAQYLELQKLRGSVQQPIAILCSDDFESKRFALQLLKTLLHADIECQLSGIRLSADFGAGGLVSVIGDVETDVVYAAFKRAGLNFAGAERATMPLSFIPANVRVICVLENPSVSKDWPPDAWKLEQANSATAASAVTLRESNI